MSHTTRVKSVPITDAAAIERAVAILRRWGIDCSLERDVEPRMYYKGQHGVCPYVLKLHGRKYDVGFEKTENGYELVLDNWLSEISSVLGNREAKTEAGRTVGKLLQAYALASVQHAAVTSGYMIEQESIKDGRINLVVGL